MKKDERWEKLNKKIKRDERRKITYVFLGIFSVVLFIGFLIFITSLADAALLHS